ncbi:MAG TPA: MTH938/NDUFAF3 family protein [Atribacterota bacterium]|nr:MTH938/NDUFAF3 family protein [Atribacterota bacterium]
MNIIEKYQFGKITVNGSSYDKDLIIFPDFIQDNWWRREGHFLRITDLETIINYRPDILIIGTGMYGLMKVDNNLIQVLKDYNVKKVIVEKTKKACIYFNNETIQKKVAALHLTC